MFENLQILGLAQARAQYAGARQAVVATNIANADTPGYRAQDIQSFQAAFRNARAGSDGGPTQMSLRRFDVAAPASPNGNTVSLEEEMLRAVEAQRAHSRALNVYRSAMNVLRTSIGR